MQCKRIMNKIAKQNVQATVKLNLESGQAGDKVTQPHKVNHPLVDATN